MSEFKTVFHKSIEQTSEVCTFIFKAPEKFDFIPGQFVQIIFDEENRSNKDLNKYISLSCAPGKEFIEITKKMTDSLFSQRLRSLKTDDQVLIKGPMGTCTYKKDSGKIGYLVGGIGITPVISILEYIAMNNIECDIQLFYGNWSEKQIAFKNDIDRWERESIKNLKVTHVIAEPEEGSSLIKGFINEDIVKQYMPDYKDRKICIFGPPKMVAAIKDVCINIGCNKDNIEVENFVGY
ncbi:MAG: FAD-dependent oxidoreductase [Candidatus Omnitrophica bacterium]|nr:FAD-dependent oxidoreductase [Candidatus Omnitrophota bacterium]MBU4334823.1 FAD-dependent oxidoreductase [Candidatus Omnitrophota bacterium]